MVQLLDPQRWEGKIFAGCWQASDGGVLQDLEPATGDVLAEIAAANAGHVRESSQTALDAQVRWAATTHTERERVMLNAAEVLRAHRDELAEWIMRECGGTQAKADVELNDAEQRLLQSAAMTREPLGQMIPTGMLGRWSFAERVPVGVVGVISPFNFPLILSIRSVAPALAAGNAVVLKPDVRTPVSGGLIIARLFEEAGLPDGLLHVLPGPGAEVGDALVKDSNTSMISFTGSTPVGRIIGENAGRNLKRVVLELGGKNPFIVLEDADVDVAAKAGAWSSYFHQGQICMSAGRHLVHESIADDYVRALTEEAEKLRVGDPFREDVELGPVIDESQRDNIHRIVRESADAGATLATGGEYTELFYRPTVLTGVKRGMAAYDEEIFGPVAPVTTFRDDDEAVQLANDTEYGLKAAVHSKDMDRALAVGRRVLVGTLHVNGSTVNDEAVAPFPAVKASGNLGAFGGQANVEEFTRWQWTTARPDQFAIPLGAS